MQIKINKATSIAMAFISTIVYLTLTIIFKKNEMDANYLILNLVYAIYVGLTLFLDRWDIFKTQEEARLVSLGGALAPIASVIIDAMFTFLKKIEITSHIGLITFSIIATCIWIAMLVAAASIPNKL